MITNESVMDRLSVVGRMVAYQQDQGAPLQEALANAKRHMPEEFSNSVDIIERITVDRKNTAFTGYGAGPFKMMATLARVIDSERGDVVRLFVGAGESMQNIVVQAREYWSGFNSLISYLSVVLSLSVVIVLIFKTKILPHFSATFDEFGSELPMLTKLFISNELMFVFIFGFLALSILTCVVTAYHVKKQISQLTPLSPVCQWLPVLRPFSRIYSYFLFVHFSNMLIQSKLGQQAALNHAVDLSKVRAQKVPKLLSWWQAVVTAQKLGVMEQEIDYQMSQIDSMLGQQMMGLRESITLIVQISIGLFVGLVIIAMYLPIFVLGSTV